MSLYIFATEHGCGAFFVPNTINVIISSLSKHSKMQFCFMYGPSGVLPGVLPFTQFYPGFAQLPRVKLY